MEGQPFGCLRTGRTTRPAPGARFRSGASRPDRQCDMARSLIWGGGRRAPPGIKCLRSSGGKDTVPRRLRQEQEWPEGIGPGSSSPRPITVNPCHSARWARREGLGTPLVRDRIGAGRRESLASSAPPGDVPRVRSGLRRARARIGPAPRFPSGFSPPGNARRVPFSRFRPTACKQPISPLSAPPRDRFLACAGLQQCTNC